MSRTKTVTELISRVTILCLLATPVVAAGATWFAGFPGAVGTVAGSAIALVHFRWLARGATRTLGGGPVRALSLAGLGLRFAGTFATLALTLATGWAHPLAVIAGLSVLPPALVAEGARTRG